MGSKFVDKPFLIRLVSYCVSLAELSGRHIRDVALKGNYETINKSKKGGFDPQTLADRLSQQCIIDGLEEKFPNLQIFAEEDISEPGEPSLIEGVEPNQEVLEVDCPERYESLTETEVYLWVDPLDATYDFSNGHYEPVTVLIGVVDSDGNPIAGIIHQPFYKKKSETGQETESFGQRTVWGIVGAKVYGLEQHVENRGLSPIVLVSKNHKSVKGNAAARHLSNKIQEMSGCGFKGLSMIENYADVMLYVGKGTKKWDTCAIDAIILALDGRMTDIDGNQLKYKEFEDYENRKGVLASMKNHNVYLERLKSYQLMLL